MPGVANGISRNQFSVPVNLPGKHWISRGSLGFILGFFEFPRVPWGFFRVPQYSFLGFLRVSPKASLGPLKTNICIASLFGHRGTNGSSVLLMMEFSNFHEGKFTFVNISLLLHFVNVFSE